MAINDEIKAAIDSGDVKAETDKVSISEKASPTGKKAEKEYTRLIALSARGMAVLCGGKLVPATPKPTDDEGKEVEDTRTDADKAPGACDFFNYGYDLDVRAKVRSSLMSDLEGPEKAIKKAVDSLVANAGFSETQARELVVTQRKAAGLPV